MDMSKNISKPPILLLLLENIGIVWHMKVEIYATIKVVSQTVKLLNTLTWLNSEIFIFSFALLHS